MLEGALSYPSETGSWQLGDIDLGEYLDQYRGKQIVLIIAPVGDAPRPNYTCGICGFVMSEAGECAGCKLANTELEREAQTPEMLDQVRDVLEGQNGGPGAPQRPRRLPHSR